MNDGFRQRLVGAVVLVCLGLISWPLIFTDSEGPVMDRRSQIPPVPAFDKFEVPEPVAPTAIVPPEPPAEAAEPDLLVSELPDQPQQDSQGLPQAWSLQVASFSKADNARSMMDQLLSQGYKAYTRDVGAAQQSATRVLVGPYMDKSLIVKYKNKIDKAFAVQSLVVRYVP